MKTQDSPGFWKDPKVIISILAMMGTLGNFLWSLKYQTEQNERWETLNVPNPQIRDAHLVPYAELKLDEVTHKKWGYEQKYFAKPGSLNDIVLYHILIAQDSAGQIIENINPVFTIPDLIKELKRINFKRPVSIFKKYNPQFTFENMGKTEAKNLLINIEVKLPGGKWENVTPDKTRFNMAVGQSNSTSFYFMVPVKDEIPEKIECKVAFEFQGIDGKYINRVVNTKWESWNNLWTFQ